ncbi:27280_t:CDS:1, partial [Gigaspora margarita]
DSSSQMDDIWASYSVLLNLTKPRLIDAEESTKSDHKIIITEMIMDELVIKTRWKKTKKKIYLYDRMNEEK